MPLPGTGWQRRAAGTGPGRWGSVLAPVRLTSDMSFPRWLRDPGVWGQLVLFLLVALGLPIAVRQTSARSALGRILRPAGSWRYLGLVLVTIGLALVVAGARSMGENLTPATTPRLQGELVADGTYCHVRHSIYLGVILVLRGLGWLQSTWLTGLRVAGTSLAYFDRKAAAEERKLAARFPEYQSYRDGVPRLLPRLR